MISQISDLAEFVSEKPFALDRVSDDEVPGLCILVIRGASVGRHVAIMGARETWALREFCWIIR